MSSLSHSSGSVMGLFFLPNPLHTKWHSPWHSACPTGNPLIPLHQNRNCSPSCIYCLHYQYPILQAREVRIILGPSSLGTNPVPVQPLLIYLCNHLSELPLPVAMGHALPVICMLVASVWWSVSLLCPCCLRYVSTRTSGGFP